MSECETKYFGKYRGTVATNHDSKQLGRIQVSVPAVLEAGRMSWAMPCVPYAGDKVGLFAIPPVGANVWVEFEGGDPDYPIWTGCFWGEGEVPSKAKNPETKVFKTGAITLVLSDVPGAGGFTLEVSPPAVSSPVKIVLDAKGIEISTATGSLKLTQSELELSQKPAKLRLSSSSIELKNGASVVELSPSSVSVNGGALEVM